MKKIVSSILFCCLLCPVGVMSAGQQYESSYKKDILVSAAKSIIGGVATVVAGTILIKQMAKYLQRQQEEQKLFNISLTENTRFSDVIGQEPVIQEVRECVDFLRKPEEFLRLGARAPKGLLLEGPPGNGKTLLARAIAGEAGCCFIYLNGGDFSKKYYGEGPQLVEALFEYAKANTPAIIFIDEFDSIGSRTNSEWGNRSDFNNVINKFLEKMDGFEPHHNVLVVGATNFKDSIDKTLLRPGRFDRIVHVPQPTKKGRAQILRHYLGKIELDSAVYPEALAEELAQRTMGFSAAKLAHSLVNEAAILAARDKADFVSQRHLEQAYDRAMLGMQTNIERTARQRKHTAYHEAGHALTTILTGLPFAKVSIAPRSNSLGVSFSKQKYESYSDYTREELLHHIMVAQAGMIAEKLIFGQENPAGGTSDLEHAAEAANQIVRQFGAGQGQLHGVVQGAVHSDAMKEKFDMEVIRVLNDCAQKTEQLLQRNKQKLIYLAEGLLKSHIEELSEAQVRAIVG